MQRLPGGHGAPSPRGRHGAHPARSHRAPKPEPGGPDPRRLRLLGLTVAVAFTLALPLVASAGPLGDAGDTAARRTTELVEGAAERVGEASAPTGPSRSSGSASGGGPAAGPDGKAHDRHEAAKPSRSHMLLGVGLATAARCGPEVTSPDGIEAQTCVLTQGDETWARTYYRNATGRELSSVLSMMAPGDRTVRVHCAVGADDEPGACETPRERTRGESGAYTAVAEFAAPDGSGPLLLRSGSNSARSQGR